MTIPLRLGEEFRSAAPPVRCGLVNVRQSTPGAPRVAPVTDAGPEPPYDAWRHVVDTNPNGALPCARAAYRQRREQDPEGGRIINNGSVSAHAPRPHPVATRRPT